MCVCERERESPPFIHSFLPYRDAKLIYECFVELTGPSEGSEAQIRFVYPRDYEWEEDIKKQIPKFTFPTKASK